VSYTVVQTRRFAKQYKKLHDNIIVDVDQAVDAVATNPELGERKKGDLAILRVYKFRCHGQLYLLGYTVDDIVQLVSLEAISSHENFYRDLKR
jgi:mRNA-degrading endonuclease RelE of RelBE toxin-antitoxin system